MFLGGQNRLRSRGESGLMGKFTTQINTFNKKVAARYKVVSRESVQETVAIAQVPVGDGGRMRVATGF